MESECLERSLESSNLVSASIICPILPQVNMVKHYWSMCNPWRSQRSRHVSFHNVPTRKLRTKKQTVWWWRGSWSCTRHLSHWQWPSSSGFAKCSLGHGNTASATRMKSWTLELCQGAFTDGFQGIGVPRVSMLHQVNSRITSTWGIPALKEKPGCLSMTSLKLSICRNTIQSIPKFP